MSKGKVVPVWFGDDEEELLKKIEVRCKYRSKSSFMKQAAAEKIAREEINQNAFSPSQPGNNGLGDMFDEF